MLRTALTSATALLVLAAPALAQDATEVDPDHYKVEFENDEVRVLRITYAPGEKSVMHWHPDAVAVMLTGGTMLMHMPDGSSVEANMAGGQVSWTPAVTHQPENTSGGEMQVVLIEMKDHHGDMMEHEEPMEEHMEHMQDHGEHMDDDEGDGGSR